MKKLVQFLNINEEYSTVLSKQEILEILENKAVNKNFWSLKSEHFNFMNYESDKIKIQRYNYGLDVFIRKFPLVKIWIKQENPTLIEVKLSPQYFYILFFKIVGLSFVISAFLMNEITVNGVLRKVVYIDRLLFFGVGCVILILGYLVVIKPIKKTKLWLIKLFKLKKIKA